MTITTGSSRVLDQDVTCEKRATKSGPLFITNRGKPVHALLSIEESGGLARESSSTAADGTTIRESFRFFVAGSTTALDKRIRHG